MIHNVRDAAYGAIGNGIADDTAAITAAMAACANAGGGAVYLPSGTYAIAGSLPLRSPNMTVYGDGMFSTNLKKTGAAGSLWQTSSSYPVDNIAFEKIGFDLSGNLGNGFSLYGSALQGNDLRWSRCRFWFGDAHRGRTALSLTGCTNLTVEGCDFESAGGARCSAINVGSGIRNLTIRDNKFLWLADGIIIDTGTGQDNQNENIAENINILNNYFDFGWWLIKAAFSGIGGAITYAANKLTDPNANFSNIELNNSTNVRVMPLLQAGNGIYTFDTTLVDSSAKFITNGVMRGHIVRTNAVWGVVKNVLSETKLAVEQWLDNTTYRPNTTHPANTPYEVYGIYIGLVKAFTATTITVDRWHDLNGTTITPVGGTRYEVMHTRPNYCMHSEFSFRKSLIAGNTCLRGWSDQISLYGYNLRIIDNFIEDGEDMAITVHGQDNIVSNNWIHHQGAGGIWAHCDYSTIHDNVVLDSQWVNAANNSDLGDIMVYGGKENTVHHNRCRHLATTQNRYGIVIFGLGKDTSHNTVEANTCIDHTVAGIQVAGTSVSNTLLRQNKLKSSAVGWVPVKDAAPGTVMVN